MNPPIEKIKINDETIRINMDCDDNVFIFNNSQYGDTPLLNFIGYNAYSNTPKPIDNPSIDEAIYESYVNHKINFFNRYNINPKSLDIYLNGELFYNKCMYLNIDDIYNSRAMILMEDRVDCAYAHHLTIFYGSNSYQKRVKYVSPEVQQLKCDILKYIGCEQIEMLDNFTIVITYKDDNVYDANYIPNKFKLAVLLYLFIDKCDYSSYSTILIEEYDRYMDDQFKTIFNKFMALTYRLNSLLLLTSVK